MITDVTDSNEVKEEIQKARRRSPIIDSAFQKVRGANEIRGYLMGSDYVRALEVALVNLEEELADLKKDETR